VLKIVMETIVNLRHPVLAVGLHLKGCWLNILVVSF